MISAKELNARNVKEWEDIEKCNKKLVKDPKDKDALESLVLLYVWKDMAKEARKVLEWLRYIDSSWEEMYDFMESNIYVLEKDYVSAQGILSKLYSGKWKYNGEVVRYYGVVTHILAQESDGNLQVGLLGKARRLLEEAWEMSKYDAVCIYDLARVYMLLTDPEPFNRLDKFWRDNRDKLSARWADMDRLDRDFNRLRNMKKDMNRGLK